MTVKKVYIELVELLKANPNKKVETLMPQILEMVTSKQAQKNFIVNEQGDVTHIYCYYHKKWEALEDVEYGAKKHSPSGYNSMCKEGVNQWTKQQREFKSAESNILNRVMAGELTPDEIHEERIRIEEEKNRIVPREDGHGSDQV